LRRSAVGWNIKYEFNDSDLETSNTMLKLFLDSQDEVPWDALLFITGHISDGGRVTDDRDRRLLMTYAREIFNDNLIAPECWKPIGTEDLGYGYPIEE
jgi:dynein heavy chain